MFYHFYKKVNILQSKFKGWRSLKGDSTRAGALWERYDTNVVSEMRNSLIKSKERERAGGGEREGNLAGSAVYASVTRGECSAID